MRISKNRKFDGRSNFLEDDKIEKKLTKYFKKYNISALEASKNFPIYTRRVFLKKFLAHYELFQKIQNLPGDIVELGVYRGVSLMSWANFVEIKCMGDRHKKILGFDNFKGFGVLDKKDGKEDKKVNKVPGGFKSQEFEKPLLDAIKIYDEDRFISYKKRIEIIKGNVEKTVPEFFNNNPGIRISLLHFDVDLYRPTKIALETLWPLIVKGGAILFDEYAIPPWEGESKAVDEFFESKKLKYKIKRFQWSTNPGGYLIKE
jgi:hypothetical protein